MRKNILLIALLFLLLVSTTGAAFAAEEPKLPEPFCGKLAKSDCDLIKKSQEASTAVESMVTNIQIDLAVSGIPEMPFEELAFSITEDAVIFTDPAMMAEMNKLAQMDAEALLEDPEKMSSMIVDFYATLGLDLNLNITMPSEVAELLSADAPVAIPEEITLHVIMKDGFAYVATEDLAIFEPAIAEMGEWIGIDFAGLMEKALSEGMAQNPADLQAMATSFSLGNILNAEASRNMIEEYVLVERLKDGKAGTQKTAVFQNSFDFAGFVTSEAFWDLVTENLDTINAMSDTQITEEELQEAKLALTFLGPAIFKDLEFATTQSIGQKDYHLYASTLDLNWDLTSIAAFAEAAQSGGKLPKRDADAKPALITIGMESTNSDFNDAPEIEAPENATIIPLEALESAMGDSGSAAMTAEEESSDTSDAATSECASLLSLDFVETLDVPYTATVAAADMDEPLVLECPGYLFDENDDTKFFTCSETGIILSGLAPEELELTISLEDGTEMVQSITPEYEPLDACAFAAVDVELEK
jgi:hypothetical protein